MKIRPLHDRVVVRRVGAETISAGGIIIPDNAREKPVQGEVLAVGDGALLESGDRRVLDLKIGDRVLFSKYAGTEVKIENKKYLILKETDVLAIVQ